LVVFIFTFILVMLLGVHC